jgi:hypothetical protein
MIEVKDGLFSYWDILMEAFWVFEEGERDLENFLMVLRSFCI